MFCSRLPWTDIHICRWRSLRGVLYICSEWKARRLEAHYMDLAMDRKIVMQLKDDITQIYANTFYYMEQTRQPC
mgnify:CR=1 FL=1